MRVIFFSSILLFVIAIVNVVFADTGIQFAKRGVACMDSGNVPCVIDNLEKALDANDLNLAQRRSINNSLRTHYHLLIEKNLTTWPAEKTEKSCKRAIELSEITGTSGDWYDVSFYLWAAITLAESGNREKARAWIGKAEKVMSQQKYKKDLENKALIPFENWAKKIINAIYSRQ